MDTFTVVSFLATAASLVLAVVAIWIALHMKDKADEVNERTLRLLVEIRKDAEATKQYALPELKAYGDKARELMLARGVGDADALPPKVKQVLDESAKRFEARFERIEGQSDVTAIKQEIAALKEQMKSSQQSVKESVIESTREIPIIAPGGMTHSARMASLDNEIYFLAFGYRLQPTEYAKEWFLKLRATGDPLKSPDNVLAQINTLTSHLSKSKRDAVLDEGLKLVVVSK